VRLKWSASKLGMEKITLKGGLMLISFVSEPRSSFYRSATFVNLMNHINHRPNLMKMRQKDTKLTLIVNSVQTVSAAASALSLMLRDVENKN